VRFLHNAFLIKGLLIGFAIAAPAGPIGVLCIRRTLARGRSIGFLSGPGAATAELLCASVAAFGLRVGSVDRCEILAWVGRRHFPAVPRPGHDPERAGEAAAQPKSPGGRGRFGTSLFPAGGIFLGSASRWLALSTGVGALHERFRPAWLTWANRTAGAVLTASGAAASLSSVRSETRPSGL